jgi:hypothetical protein
MNASASVKTAETAELDETRAPELRAGTRSLTRRNAQVPALARALSRSVGLTRPQGSQ